jgi:hypothetical protein
MGWVLYKNEWLNGDMRSMTGIWFFLYEWDGRGVLRYLHRIMHRN